MDLFSVSLHPLDKKYYIFIHYYSNSKWIVPLYIPSKAIHFKTYSLWLKFSNFFVKSEKNIVGSSTRLRAETTLVAPLDKRFTWVCSSWTTNYVCCPWRTQLGVFGIHCNVVSGLSSWCRSNALFLNVEKTECIYFSNKNVYVKRMIISCSGREIVSKESIKFLGIHLDHLLKSGFYVDSVSKRLSSSLYTVNRIKLSLHIESILNVYFSLVWIILIYCVDTPVHHKGFL